MKTPKNEGGESVLWSDALFQDSSETMTVNIQLPNIATNAVTLKLCYHTLEAQLKNKLRWFPLLCFTLTALTPLATVSDYNTFGWIKEGFWQTFYFFAAVIPCGYMIYYARKYRKDPPSAEGFIKSIQKESPPLSGAARDHALAGVGVQTFSTSDKRAFDEMKRHTWREYTDHSRKRGLYNAP